MPLKISRRAIKNFKHFNCTWLLDSRIRKHEHVNNFFLPRWCLHNQPGEWRFPGACRGLVCPPRHHRPKCSERSQMLRWRETEILLGLFPSKSSLLFHCNLSFYKRLFSPPPTQNSTATMNQLKCLPTPLEPGL